ncbi:MAG TPA: hypothetical protein VLA72_05645 [Anaerolineales bacterium]|nr:hypothetical protein [Anaerolineales bacterium]
MSYNFLFVLNALVALVFGIAFLFVPDTVLLYFGVTDAVESTEWVSRFFGSAMFALGLVLWFAKDTDANIQKNVGYSLLASSIIGLVVTIMASVADNAVIRSNSWIPIVVYVLFALGYAFMLFLKPKMKE